ncbi:MAG: O-antigen ligase family protein [Chthonomonadales bacterium]
MNYPDIFELQRQSKTRNAMLMSALVFTTVLIIGIIGAIYNFGMTWEFGLYVGIGILVVIAIPVLIWNSPKVGFYFVFFGTMLFEGVTNGYGANSLILTSNVPFFWNLNNLGGQFGSSALGLFKFSIAEAIIVLTMVVWIVKAISARDFRVEKGAFFPWFAAYMAMVVFGLIRGIATSGDAQMALWEVRSQFHMFFAYLMGANLIKERKDVFPLLWCAIIGIGLKAFVGINAYAQMSVITDQGVLMHEESLFFNVILFIAVVAWLSKSDTKMKWISLILSPIGIFVALQNQRRSGIAAFIMAFIPLMPILYHVLEKRKTTVKRFLIGFTIFNIIYLLVAWNGNGPWALPARAIRSNSDPNERDASSDYYRLAENINLKATRDRSPFIGIGYGKPYDMLVYQPGVENFDELLRYLPHNSIMWIWMRIGHIGFLCFMMLLATVCIKGVQILKAVQDPILQTIGSLGIVAPIMLFAFGKFDMAMVNYRIVIMTGSFMGVLSILPKLYKKPDEAPSPEDEGRIDETASFRDRPTINPLKERFN